MKDAEAMECLEKHSPHGSGRLSSTMEEKCSGKTTTIFRQPSKKNVEALPAKPAPVRKTTRRETVPPRTEGKHDEGIAVHIAGDSVTAKAGTRYRVSRCKTRTSHGNLLHRRASDVGGLHFFHRVPLVKKNQEHWQGERNASTTNVPRELTQGKR